MKKSVLIVTFTAVIVLFVGYNVYSSHRTGGLSDLALANVEALAQGEWGEYPNIWYQECGPCYTIYHNPATMFYCNVGIDNCFDSNCIGGYCF